jgi:hypothetical protein
MSQTDDVVSNKSTWKSSEVSVRRPHSPAPPDDSRPIPEAEDGHGRKGRVKESRWLSAEPSVRTSCI